MFDCLAVYEDTEGIRLIIESQSGDRIQLRSSLIGAVNASNILTALAIGAFHQCDVEKMVSAIEAYRPLLNRSQLLREGDVNWIVDAYNANPDSMKHAIHSFIQSNHPGKMMIVGDIE